MKIYNLAFLFLLLYPFAFPIADGEQNLNKKKSSPVNLVFKSGDAGKTWQDISEGLPENLQEENFFANENGLFLTGDNLVFQSEPHSAAPFWKKEVFPDKQGGTLAGKSGIFAYDYEAQFSQHINKSNVWSPMYNSFQIKYVRTVFEAGKGTVLIGCNNGLFKSVDYGKTWKLVNTGGWVMKLVESNGVLLATSQGGILRSTDAGDSWDLVISEGGVGIAVEPIKGGFAAITYNTQSETRRMRTSYDGGKTWQAIDAGLPANLSISSIVQVGEDFYCGHPDGIFKSSDKGQTWKMLLPSIDDKVFNLFVSGDVIYAVKKNKGC